MDIAPEAGQELMHLEHVVGADRVAGKRPALEAGDVVGDDGHLGDLAFGVFAADRHDGDGVAAAGNAVEIDEEEALTLGQEGDARVAVGAAARRAGGRGGPAGAGRLRPVPLRGRDRSEDHHRRAASRR